MIRLMLLAVMRLYGALWRARQIDRRWFLAWSVAIAALELGFVWAAATVVVWLAWVGAVALAVILGALLTWLMVPHWLLDRLVVPRGWHRAAWFLARTDVRGDGELWQRLMAARALARAGAPAAAVAWLLARQPQRLDATGVVVHGLIAHARGDRDDARRLMRSVAELVEPSASPRDVAGQWLALDAAERGAWAELAAEADAAAWPATPLRVLLETVAQRAVGAAGAPSRFGLWARWLVAPARRATWAMVRRPPTTPAATTDADGVAGADAAAPADPHAAALAAHGRALGQRTGAATTAAVAAWAAVVDDPAWLDRQVARAGELGLDPASARATAAAARDRLTAHLVELVVATRAPLPDGDGGLATAVHAQARNRLLAGLELTFDRLHARVGAGAALASIDEWREFLAVRAGYLDAVAPGGAELERVAYPHADTGLGAMTVWLWNSRGEHVLSHAITSWLYQRATVVGDAASIEHHGRNRGLAVPTT